MIDNRKIEKEPIEGILNNIIGTANVSIQCTKFNSRMVYISTDYVYKGSKGNYSEENEVLPFNMYAWTKLGGECSVKCVPNHLIIRTSFGSDKFPYDIAFENQYTSKDYVSVIAPMIYKAATSDMTGILNIGTQRKSMYEYAIQKNPNITKIETEYQDHSLNTFRFHEIE